MPDHPQTTPQDAQAAAQQGERTPSQMVATLGGGGISRSQGSYREYRRLRMIPTVALAEAVAKIPMRLAETTIEYADDAPDERIAFIQTEVDRLWPRLLKDMLWALDMGHASFEKVWQVANVNGRQVVRIRKLKYLIPEAVEHMVDKETGAFAGIKQKQVELPPAQSFVFTYDKEGDDTYGRSRHENYRRWAADTWRDTKERLQKYVQKVAGVIPMVEYPEGESTDQHGQEVPNYELAKRVLASLGKGHGVAMPNSMAPYAEDIGRGSLAPEKLKAWRIDFLEAAAHGSDLLGILGYDDKLIFRGWLVPERAALEGEHGTKAEAGEHGDLGEVVAALTLNDMVDHVNRYVIDPLLLVNFGEDAQGSVYLGRAGLDSATRAFYRTLIDKILGTANTPLNDEIAALIQVDQLADGAGLPRRTDGGGNQ